ncbi:glycerol-3-phosphate dehydrogenase/oxidase [Labrys monachus]|uniref:Glycerol-3-phosphate dehydrogenase n=1 Tax=Labrys monachus TaxID=217067 RepID=A0ABU0FFF0_9HYPH|nr:glycerol-3-phosphate dehydrogenase/oxidase [Labrys monachus]MDQ0393335.1 glycerol-3-phosphate dehydrogenase [Labrys monachus]
MTQTGSTEFRRSPSTREQRKARLRADPSPQVLVVGGGINGIGTFRELALQGVKVLLAEKGDFCSGASSAPSRMIHGGLRYLENGEFSLVRESLLERNRLLTNAPHYVSPLPTTVPIFDYLSGALGAAARFVGLSEGNARRGALVIKLGLTLYDILTRHNRLMPTHRFSGSRETRRRWPDFAPEIKCSATYYDAHISYPERLGLELVQDTLSACPDASALNYAGVEAIEGGKVVVRDMLTGERFAVSPAYVVNAAGAWIDGVNGRMLGGRAEKRLIGGTKGSHLVVRNERLLRELGDNMVYYENQEGRVCIMFAHFGNVLVGSTDIRVDNPETVRCEADEQAYMLESVRTVFPNIRIAPEQILYTYSGVRPLPYREGGATGTISRDHSFHRRAATAECPFPILSLIGGKWTTFRAFGEQAADQVLKDLDMARRRSTRELAIGGGREFPRTPEARGEWIRRVSQETGLAPHRIEELLPRYGSAAREVAAFIAAGADAPLATLPDYSRREILRIIRHEDVETPEDILVRRTAVAIAGRLTLAVVEEVTGILAEDRRWAEAEREKALRDTVASLSARHGFVPPSRSLQDVERNRIA